MQTVQNREELIKDCVKKTNLRHIAIIMDGNRRWAKNHHLPSAMGHKKGVEALKTTVKGMAEFGVKYITVYAFSTENWNRKQEEVDFLMNLFVSTIQNELDELHANNVKLRFLGNMQRLNDTLRETLKNAEIKTEKNTGVNLQIAINYGARDEITRAVQQIVKENLPADKITEELIGKYLYTKDIPDPDLLIRTGGEKRISNYLLWQIAYSEIYVTNKFWPEFDREELANSIEEFGKRQRRYGG